MATKASITLTGAQLVERVLKSEYPGRRVSVIVSDIDILKFGESALDEPLITIKYEVEDRK